LSKCWGVFIVFMWTSNVIFSIWGPTWSESGKTLERKVNCATESQDHFHVFVTKFSRFNVSFPKRLCVITFTRGNSVPLSLSAQFGEFWASFVVLFMCYLLHVRYVLRLINSFSFQQNLRCWWWCLVCSNHQQR